MERFLPFYSAYLVHIWLLQKGRLFHGVENHEKKLRVSGFDDSKDPVFRAGLLYKGARVQQIFWVRKQFPNGKKSVTSFHEEKDNKTNNTMNEIKK